jgi:hypothetical protein
MRYPEVGEKIKFTLKNRPKTLFAESSFAKWFEGFEKELRERIAQLEKTDRTAYGKAILKEILGE